MYIGSSLFLLAAGAILALAVQDMIDGVDLTMIGWILVAVGALGLIISIIMNGQARRREDPRAPR